MAPHPRLHSDMSSMSSASSEPWQVAAGLGLCEAELSNCSVADVLRGQHTAHGAVSSTVLRDGEPTAADVPAAALTRFLKVPLASCST